MLSAGKPAIIGPGMAVLYTIIESPLHPQASDLYSRSGLREVRFSSVRKAIQALKSAPPDIVVADFIYGYGNNYAGINISNLDVFLHSLQKYAPACRVIVCYEKAERAYAQKLAQLFEVHALLEYPVEAAKLAGLLR